MLLRAHVNVFVLLKEFCHFYQNPEVEGPFQILLRRRTCLNGLYLIGAGKAVGQGGQTWLGASLHGGSQAPGSQLQVLVQKRFPV